MNSITNWLSFVTSFVPIYYYTMFPDTPPQVSIRSPEGREVARDPHYWAGQSSRVVACGEWLPTRQPWWRRWEWRFPYRLENISFYCPFLYLKIFVYSLRRFMYFLIVPHIGFRSLLRILISLYILKPKFNISYIHFLYTSCHWLVREHCWNHRS